MILKIQDKFTKKEQQLFVGSYFSFLNYNPTQDFVVELDLIWKWIGFSRKDPAKRLLEKYFIKNTDYKIVFHQSVENLDEKNKGGRPEEQILLTVHTFKKFCLKSNTKKADEIHDYYIKLEELLHETINEQTTELQNQLLLKNKEVIDKNTKHKYDLKMLKHNTLINLLKTKNCVYVGEFKENEEENKENKKKIKIGSSKQVDIGVATLNDVYADFIFLEIFECENFRETEENILKEPVTMKYLYREPIKLDGTKSREVVQLSDDFTYEQALAIVKKHVDNSHFKFLTPAQLLEKQKLDFEKQKLDFENKKMEYNMLLNINNNDLCDDTIKNILREKLHKIVQNINVDTQYVEINKSENKTETKIENKTETKIENKIETKTEKIEQSNDTTQNQIKKIQNQLQPNETQNSNYNKILNAEVKGCKPRGKKVQKVDPNNLKRPVAVYDSMIYALRSPENNGFTVNGIVDAIRSNKLYKNFRWNYVENDAEPKICDLPPTVPNGAQGKNIIPVLQLNSLKTEITDSFYTKKFAAQKLQIGMYKMTNIIKNYEKYNDSYYIELDKCPPELLDNYKKPINRIKVVSAKQIKQINPVTKETVIFNSLLEIHMKLRITNKTIKKAIKNKTICGGFLWEYHGE